MVNMLEIISKKLDAINLYQAIDFSVANHNSELEDLNTMQLDTGNDTEGKSLGSYKYIGYKGRLQPVDLLDEGDFRKSISAIAKDGTIEFIASDWKKDILMSKYGENIIGLPKKDLESGLVKEILIDDIILKVTQQIDAIS